MLANSSARPMRPNGTSRPARAIKFFEQDIGALALVAADDLVADNDPDMQRVDENVVRRALARQHLGERHLRGTADRGRRAVRTGALAPRLSTLMIRPQRRSFICGKTRRFKRIWANSFRSRSACQTSSVSSSEGPRIPWPALLTRMSILPSSDITWS